MRRQRLTAQRVELVLVGLEPQRLAQRRERFRELLVLVSASGHRIVIVRIPLAIAPHAFAIGLRELGLAERVVDDHEIGERRSLVLVDFERAQIRRLRVLVMTMARVQDSEIDPQPGDLGIHPRGLAQIGEARGVLAAQQRFRA